MPNANTASPAEITYACAMCGRGFKAVPSQPPPLCPSCGFLETRPANYRVILIAVAIFLAPTILWGIWMLAK